MSTGFRATSDGVTVQLDAGEVSILRSLVSQVLGLVEPGTTGDDPLERALGIGSAAPPADPVLARLFPSAYADDEDAAQEFRRYTEATLRDGKRADATTLLETAAPGRLTLTAEQGQAWLRAINASASRSACGWRSPRRSTRRSPRCPRTTPAIRRS
ncbi:DUF2017 domain-containing protein [Microbispora sp. GKU 823]|uniref:DUF2017 domain-containing protein n=1 Tax=Microbispora sp. GKU 823 TaxID=1652100 RepID=UPI00211888BF|nr:DUF2017 domain-containing protein [Microbispora sp. GKU 823]